MTATILRPATQSGNSLKVPGLIAQRARPLEMERATGEKAVFPDIAASAQNPCVIGYTSGLRHGHSKHSLHALADLLSRQPHVGPLSFLKTAAVAWRGSPAPRPGALVCNQFHSPSVIVSLSYCDVCSMPVTALASGPFRSLALHGPRKPIIGDPCSESGVQRLAT